MSEMLVHGSIMLAGVFLASFSQVMLKKSANKHYSSTMKEYANPLVIGAYAVFLLTTLMSIYALQVIPLYVGAVLESTNYLFVTFFGWYFFSESITKRRILGLAIIMIGIFVFFVG